jgi:RHH-type proline utilization regulon transcriptional repressor/proline dehydrogenase/delta 1-pyrroline-5-carboxylate dehydrogenase
LENGANTSFVNRLADDQAPISAIVADPVAKAAALPEKANPLIPIPPDLFLPERWNSLGLPLWENAVREPLVASIKETLANPATANPIVSGEEIGEGGDVAWVTSPHDRRVVVGTCRSASPKVIRRSARRKPHAAIGTGWEGSRAPPSSNAPPIYSRPTAPD